MRRGWGRGERGNGERENAWGLLEKNRTVATGKPDAPVQDVCHAANLRPQTPKNFQNMIIFMFSTLFRDIYVAILLGDLASVVPKATETPSRGTLAPLYGGKGSELRGQVNCNEYDNIVTVVAKHAPGLSYIRSAQMVSGVKAGDARGRRPLAKKLRLSPFPSGEGGRGDGANRSII